MAPWPGTLGILGTRGTQSNRRTCGLLFSFENQLFTGFLSFMFVQLASPITKAISLITFLGKNQHSAALLRFTQSEIGTFQCKCNAARRSS